MTEKTLTTDNIKPAIDALRGELAPWPVVAMKQDRLNDTQKSAVNSGITSGLVAQIIANTAAIRALESAITGTGLRPLVVASLPAIGTQGILYIVPVTTYDPATDADVVNYSNEYIWIVAPDAPVTEGYYEQVGQTGIVINNGQLTITVNGTSVGTFTANQSGDTTAAITVPTNADYVDRTTAQTAAGVKTFSDGIVGNVTGNVTGDLTGTASRAIADEDGTSIKSGYVNVAGNQTVSGQKTWSGNQFFTAGVYHRNNSYEIGNTPASNVAIPIYFTDKNNVYTGYVRSTIYTSGRSATEIRAKNAFKNGVLDPTGSDISSNLNVEVQPSGAKTIYWDGLLRNDVTPYTTNNNSLGSSTNQWSSVYAQTYYYNGTQWGLDQANTWNAHQKFTGSNTRGVLSIYNTAYTKGSSLSSTELGLGAIYLGNSGQIGLASSLGFISTDLAANGARTLLSLSAMENTASSATRTNVIIQYDKNDAENPKKVAVSGAVLPNTDATFSLGTSTNKWKTLNGINPGALGMPSATYTGSNAIVEIDRTGWVYDGTANSYSPPVDCWMSISNGGLITVWGVNTAFGMKATDNIAIPLRLGESYNVSLTHIPDFCRIYPCGGNV